MKNREIKYLQYPRERDAVFVFGAGTSQPDGVPLQKEIFPYIITDSTINNSTIGKEVIGFINDNFYYDLEANLYPRLEAVFGYMDYFLQQKESLSSRYTYEKIRDIHEYLIKLVHHIIDKETDKGSRHYTHFWDNIAEINPNISIINLNYDTLLEHSFEHLYGTKGYIDYCIHLMNYDKEDKLKNFNFWINPREPVMVDSGLNPFPVKIIKLHGSLNWKYCNLCNQTLLTPWDRKIDLNSDKFIGHTYPDKEEYEYYCPLDGNEFETLIMPPSYVKELKHPAMMHLFAEAAREIRATKKIIFVGYSMSNADIHIKALFKKNITDEDEIIVINAKDTINLESKYKALSSNVKFNKVTFQSFVKDTKLIKELIGK